jgi:hypothetical protein
MAGTGRGRFKSAKVSLLIASNGQALVCNQQLIADTR